MGEKGEGTQPPPRLWRAKKSKLKFGVLTALDICLGLDCVFGSGCAGVASWTGGNGERDRNGWDRISSSPIGQQGERAEFKGNGIIRDQPTRQD
jgi:hypothetical protein